MCQTCVTCRSLPVEVALMVIAEEMKKNPKVCLDDLIGELIDIKLNKRNVLAEEEFERERQ